MQKTAVQLPIRFLLAAVLCLTIQACKQDIYTNIEEREANAMVATLLQKGIDAGRVMQKNGKLTVTVEESQFAQAVAALNEAGLPKTQFATMGSVFKQEGLVASPVQERAQMIYALSEELSRTVSEIDGIVSARVHVVLPDNDPLQRNVVPASASVFIRHEPNLDINTLIPQIKTLVANGIAGLTYEKVSVIPVAAVAMNGSNVGPELTSFLGIWMLPASASKAHWLFGTLIAALIVLGGALGYRLRRVKRRQIYPLQSVGPAE